MVDQQNEHIIVCGAGRTGMHIIDELIKSRTTVVIIEQDPARVARCSDESNGGKELPHVIGDATDDACLQAAGIDRARGIVAVLPDDKENLYVVLTARNLNPRLRIVAKAVDARASQKLKAAGADAVVNVNFIGGMRLASEMVRPQVVTFLDKMLHDRERTLRFEEVMIPERSPLIGKPLAKADLREARNLLIVAAYAKDGAYTYSPGPRFVLEEGMTLIMLGETDAVDRLRQSPLFRIEPAAGS